MTAGQAAPRPRRDTWVLEAAEDPTAAAQYVASVSSIFDIALHDDGAGFHNRLEAYHLGAALFGIPAVILCLILARHIARQAALTGELVPAAEQPH